MKDKVEEVVRRLHDSPDGCGSSCDFGDDCDILRFTHAAVRAGLELAAEVGEDRIRVIRGVGARQADGDPLGSWVSVVIGEVVTAIRTLASQTGGDHDR